MKLSIASKFWSSVVLTGNRSEIIGANGEVLFWSSVVLTGNRSMSYPTGHCSSFGVASF